MKLRGPHYKFNIEISACIIICVVNTPVIEGFPLQRASDVDNRTTRQNFYMKTLQLTCVYYSEYHQVVNDIWLTSISLYFHVMEQRLFISFHAV